jgi:hypothetical protein
VRVPRATAVCVLLGSCNGQAPPTAGGPEIPLAPKSGSRLRVQYLVAADGGKTFAGWFDQDRQERCHFALAEDFELRCLPERSGEVVRSCGEPFVSYGQGEVCDPRYAEDPPSRAVYQLDGAGAVGPVMIGKCAEGGPDRVTYRAQHVDPAVFLRARRARRSSDEGQRLTPLDLVGDDGSVEPRGWYDLALNAECAAGIAADGRRRCLPVADSCLRADFYADGACQEVYSNTTDTCVPGGAPRFARGPHPLAALPSGCPDDRSDVFRPTGEERTAGGSLYTRDAAGACAAATAPWGKRRVLVALDPTMFAALSSAPATPAGTRLRDPQLGLHCSQGCALDTAFQDGDLALPCRFAATEAGALRCLPAARARLYFADAACTRPLVGGQVMEPLCLGGPGGAVPPRHAALAADLCAPVTRAVTLGSPAALAAVYEMTSAGCQETRPPGSLFEVGPDLALDRFTAGMLQTE